MLQGCAASLGRILQLGYFRSQPCRFALELLFKLCEFRRSELVHAPLEQHGTASALGVCRGFRRPLSPRYLVKVLANSGGLRVLLIQCPETLHITGPDIGEATVTTRVVPATL